MHSIGFFALGSQVELMLFTNYFIRLLHQIKFAIM